MSESRTSKDCCSCGANPDRIWKWIKLGLRISISIIILMFVINIFIDRSYSLTDWWDNLIK